MSFSFSRLKEHLHGFRLVQVDPLEEFQARGALYVHERTGARVYHLEVDDRENLASFVFPTPPEDDTGVAHILEHTVLCGSRRYPTKDPFLYLAKSSLNTFLNAMTYPDKTVYPVATVVPKDFYNLFRVYADAVFHPLLKSAAFRQEGHRLEWDDKEGLLWSGVVYNEMKGNYSSAESVIYDAVQRSLFDQGPYSFDSGGDPRFIPQLTHEGLVDFHRSHYHPSVSLTFLYGDLPAGPALKILDREVFAHTEKRSADFSLEKQPRRSAPRTLQASYPAQAEGEEDGGTLALTWLGPDALEVDTILVFDVLTEILLGDAGVLQKTLLESGLGQDLSPVSGLETELREAIFTVALRGAPAQNAQAFERLVFDELTRWSREGFPKDLVEGVLASYEFSVKEVKGGGMGLRFLRRLMRGWLHGASPAEALAFAPLIEKLRKRLEAGERVFESLIETQLLQNPHRVLVTCVPDAKKLVQDEEAAKERLAQMRIHLSAEELERLKAGQEEVRAFQEEPDSPKAVASLPVLELRDIPRKVETPQALQDTAGPIHLSLHEAGTNGIAYLDLGFDLAPLSREEWLLLPLWQRCLDGLGLKGLSYDLLARRLALSTGGLSVRASADTSVSGQPQFRLWVRIKMLDSKIDEALDLLESILLKVDWDNYDRLKDLLLERKNELASALVPRGHMYAVYKSSQGFSLPSTINDWTGGLSQMDFLAQLDPSALQKLADQLSALSRRVLVFKNTVAALSGASSALERLKARLTGWSALFPTTAEAPARLAAEISNTRHGLRVIPSSVGFNALTLPGCPLAQAGHEAELVLAHALRTGFLWEKIRMKGGAYGAMTFTNPLEATFAFATYRDPRLVDSLNAFKEGLEFYRSNPLLRRDLINTILGAVSGDLSPRSPAEDGFMVLQRSLLGITDEMRQKKRDTMRRLTARDLVRASERLLSVWDQGISFSLTSAAIAEQAQADGTYVLTKV
jgi:Zn-dependent M16 (insulinase) family peptidase